MTPAKLQIETNPAAEGGPIEVLFNPTSYSISKSVTWEPQNQGRRKRTQRAVNAPTLNFGGGGSRQLTLDLFFDVTENPGVEDVRLETDKIVALTRINRDKGRPPTCKVSWGSRATKDFPFVGVVSNLEQEFTLFRGDGTPVRAVLSVTFTEYLDPVLDQRETDPERTARVVRRGDTLSAIAADVYGDPSKWRAIADENELDDPLRIEPGRILAVPERP
jgi:nucleoid-associated protein YgaU